jgi:hypothetical protein
VRGSTTFVLVKEQGNWLIALAQTTPIAAGAGVPPATPQAAAER